MGFLDRFPDIRASYSVPAGSSLRLGQPAEAPPEGLVDALQSACEREPAVAEAYLYEFQIVDRDEPPHLAVGLLLRHPGDESSGADVAHAISETVDPQAWGYELVDYHVLDDDLLDVVRSSATVIFRRA